MEIIDFFNSNSLDLPKYQDDNTLSFQGFLKKHFDEYLNIVTQISSTDNVSKNIKNNYSNIKEICDTILETLQLHFEGHPSQAFSKIDSIFKKYNSVLKSLLSSPDISKEIEYLYRVRIGDSFQYSKKQMFHIPFELRHLVNVQRYSIPGLPCLYLGGSTYICWEELNRPDLHKMHIARFKPSPGTKIQLLDFGYRPAHIAAMLDKYGVNLPKNYEQFAIAQGIFWPIIFSSSIKVKNTDSPFKPEYLIPQYLLQWITMNSNCDGIRYFSCRLKYYPSNIMAVSNFVFPIKVSKDSGYCDVLTSNFLMSEPLCWQLAESCDSSTNAS